MPAIPLIIPSILSKKFSAFISPTIQSNIIGKERYMLPNINPNSPTVKFVPIKSKLTAIWPANFTAGFIPLWSSIIPIKTIIIEPAK